MQDTDGDLDILVTTSADTQVMERFLAYDEVRIMLAHGATRSSVVLKSGLQVDLRMVKTENYGAALHYFTCFKAHHISIRRLARARGSKSMDTLCFSVLSGLLEKLKNRCLPQ